MNRGHHTVLSRLTLVTSAILLILFYSGCDSDAVIKPGHNAAIMRSTLAKPIQVKPVMANATTILNRPQIPILCYHQIRDWSPSDSKIAKDYIVPVDKFRGQMKLLADNGYHTILPDQLYDYLLKGTALPSRPIMITFDDSREEQYTIARPELNKYGFKGVYFIMTVTLNKPGYMSGEEIRQLSDEHNVIGSHTWDHSNVKKYSARDWEVQLDKPTQQLEKITGKPVEYFAYPFGLWDKEAIERLKQRHFKAAFQLSTKRDEDNPLFTIRRIIVPGEWSTSTLQKWMSNSF